MKTAIIPPLRVAPEFREEVTSVLNEGESLSAFTEASIRAEVRRRTLHREFIARGLASAEKARRTGRYADASEVIDKLATKLKAARPRKGRE
ncbi:hypothetical protein SAMN05216570_3493 [Dyella sp. OK004]|uniref:YlcI/YnfO family protein n=1 Tax=Dyella sp. OK004 TaxID=1855292 RepID=UPI0008F023CD|nr:YlcI/YnfO family protein [Dyella sp. OK004]SFS17198.1 hypothetical protein SAMN05216570_3493 [Dyella sp. OK004]